MAASGRYASIGNLSRSASALAGSTRVSRRGSPPDANHWTISASWATSLRSPSTTSGTAVRPSRWVSKRWWPRATNPYPAR
jgi:hypothetical protein